MKNSERDDRLLEGSTVQDSLGRDTASLFSFKSFVPACLYIMKAGVNMHGVCIIDKSRYLESALPEANTLDTYTSLNRLYADQEQHSERYENPWKLEPPHHNSSEISVEWRAKKYLYKTNNTVRR